MKWLTSVTEDVSGYEDNKSHRTKFQLYAATFEFSKSELASRALVERSRVKELIK
jgi:hypothetical protein